jgi:phage terminase large subunit-like protein
MLSNTATPKYYGQFRDQVIQGKIPVCYPISLEMNRIDNLIRSPMYYYDDKAVEGWIEYCENELTLTDGSPVKLLDTFKLWGEELFGWYKFDEITVPERDEYGNIHYVRKSIKSRLTNKQYLIVARGNAKTMYDSFIQSYFLNIDRSTTHQITVAPTMPQADEVMSPIRTSIVRARGPYLKFLTDGNIHNTKGSIANRAHLASTKDGIRNYINGSHLEVRPMAIPKLQGLRTKVATVDEWLSCDIREDPIGAIEQGCSKLKDYLIVATSSEGTIRNGVGDSIKIELMKILKGEYYAPHVSIWYYRLDEVEEVANPSMWIKACPNIGLPGMVSYDTYQRDKERAENVPEARNDILAKRFGIPSEGYTYFFTYEETLVHNRREFWQMPCSMGVDLSRGDDFCSFTFLFPLQAYSFGVKTLCFITSRTFQNLPPALKQKYGTFIQEGSLMVLEGSVLDMNDVYECLDKHILRNEYDVRCVGYDPYNAKEFIQNWQRDNGPFGIEKVIQGAKTESVPLGELKKLAADRQLIFDQKIMQFCMGNCIALIDTNGNRKLYKQRVEEKIDSVAAMMDAFVSFKVNKDLFD